MSKSPETATPNLQHRIKHGLDTRLVRLSLSEKSPEPFLGAGSQYAVYDCGNGRVRKVPLNFEDSVAAVSKWHKGSPQEITDHAHRLLELRETGAEHVKKVMHLNPKARKFFGNPEFLSDGTILQDKVEVLADVLKERPEESDNLLWGYLRSVTQSWKYGCFDMVYNMANNTGVKDSEIVMMDFGEIATDKQWMHDMIDQRKWESSYDYNRVLNDEQRGFIRGAARGLLTHEGLDNRWEVDLPHTP